MGSLRWQSGCPPIRRGAAAGLLIGGADLGPGRPRRGATTVFHWRTGTIARILAALGRRPS
ncbi:MAG: hypothetical protein WCK95_13270 [Alphaproteobacteria bacterium]